RAPERYRVRFRIRIGPIHPARIRARDRARRLPPDRDEHVLGILTGDVRGIPPYIVVREAVRLPAERVGVPEPGVVVGGSRGVESRAVVPQGLVRQLAVG